MMARFVRLMLDWEKRGRFNGPLLLADAAIAAWLLFAQRAFLGEPLPSSHTLAKFAVGSALLAWAVQLHAFTDGKIRGLVAKAAVFALLAAGLAHWLHTGFHADVWLGGMLGLLLVLVRIAGFAARARWPDQPLEIFRWVLLLGASFAVMRPFYRAVSVGSGDAYWYTIMLADFTSQLRAGFFPVWAGQSEYAFNGAVSPLRLAPWFQHMGGLLDILTARALTPVALKNAVLAFNAIAMVFSTYGCLRVVLVRRPGLACMLAALWVASPGVLAPLIMSDLIMTFMALTFLPLVLLGCWLTWTNDGTRPRLVLAIGLSGAWLSHTPIALWATFLAIGICAAKFILRREWFADTGRAALTSAVFIVLGSFPVLSVLAIDNQNAAKPIGSVAADEVARCFPANFLPIDATPGAEPLFTIQVGYAALGAFAIALLLLLFVRARGAVTFVLATSSIALFVLPIPWFNQAFWSHVPIWFVAINNVWPMQRLFALWALLMLFSLAVVLSDQRLARRTWLTTLCLLLLAGAGVWSWQEANKLGQHLDATAASPRLVETMFARQNIVLTRYAYTSFSAAPAYASHGYMDPLLENRLLDRETLTDYVANADHAAPALRTPLEPGIMPRLVQTGLLTAVLRNGDEFKLEPKLPLAPGVRLALRLELLRPGRPGLLQAIDYGLMRQYILPDSGGGLEHPGPSRAFGSLPKNGRVIPLQTGTDRPVEIEFTYSGSSSVDDQSPPSDRFAFARYWLYTYTAEDLPIVVESWMPYRAHTEVARLAWLETPRMWLRGYHATVNGQTAEVRRSPHNLVMIPLEPGPNKVTLEYLAPLWLRGAFGISLGGWLVMLGLCARRVLAQARAFAV